MEENTSLVLSKTQLIALDKEYSSLNEKAHFDDSWETDYKAALIAPAAFLINEKATNFETTFDRILFHLDEAFKKADEASIKRSISRNADDLFSGIVFVLQTLLYELKKKNEKGLSIKLSEKARNVVNKLVKPSTYSKGGHPVISAVATVSPDVLNMLSDFFVYLNTKWNIEKEENVFYNQVSNVYQKILDSNCFSNEFGLLRNTFTKNKEDILRHVVYMKGLTAGKNLIKFDVTDSEKQESARIIIQSLSELRDWDTAIEYLNEIKDLRLANFKDLKNLLIDNFRYVAELKFKEGITKIFKNKLKPGEIKKVNKEVFEFKLKIEGKYDDYVAKQKKKLAILIVGAAVLAIIVIVGFILYNSNVQSDYKESSKLEKKRIEQIDNSISSLINEKKYTEALNMINTDLVWKETNMLASSDDESNTKDLQLNYKKKILDSILKDLKERNQLIMDEENYRYISQEMILNYNAIMKEFDESAKDDLFDQYTDKFSTIIEELNKKRNTYLEKLVLQIDTAINSNDVNKAYSLLSELYHNSEETMKSELLGLSSTSYKEYWKDKKEELSEKLN